METEMEMELEIKYFNVLILTLPYERSEYLY